MAHYVKLFDSIIHSTIWQEEGHIKIVWITLLALADSKGEVQASVPGLAKAAGVSLPQCEEALEKFLSPDKYSRSQEAEGRRIEVIQGGWELINYKKYRDMKSLEQEKENAAERQRRFRGRNAMSRNVTKGNTIVEVEEDVKIEEKEKVKTVPRKRVTKLKDEATLESILDGKGSPLWEAYWELVGIFGPAKNPAPKTTARLYRLALEHELMVEDLHVKAQELLKATSDPKYLPQLAKWLEGEGYRNPNQVPITQKSTRRTHEADDIFMEQIKAQGGDW